MSHRMLGLVANRFTTQAVISRTTMADTHCPSDRSRRGLTRSIFSVLWSDWIESTFSKVGCDYLGLAPAVNLTGVAGIGRSAISRNNTPHAKQRYRAEAPPLFGDTLGTPGTF